MEDKVQQSTGESDGIARWTAVAAITTVGSIFLWWAWELKTTTDELTLRIVERHAAAVIGLPLAGVAAFIVVVLLRQSNGPIEFEGLSFKFRGASGPVVLWIACFLSIMGALKAVY